MRAPIVASALAFVVVCMAVDIRARRIPNLLSGSAIVIGAVMNVYLFGASGLLSSVSGLLLSLVVLFGPFALGGIGGGDVKMMGAVGAFLGPKLSLSALVCGLILGGIIMLVHLARIGRLREKVGATRARITATVLTRSLAPLTMSAADPGSIALPYSVPLGLGTMIVVLAGAFGPLS